MRALLRSVLSSSILPAAILMILSLLYFMKWGTPVVSPRGRYAGIAQFVSVTWPFLAAALVCSQITWRFILKDPKVPKPIMVMNFVVIVLAVLYVLIGSPELLLAVAAH